MTHTFTLPDAFKAARRPRCSFGYFQTVTPARAALAYARRNLADFAQAEADKAAALEALAAARKVDSRLYAPGMVAARAALAKADSAWRRAWDSCYPLRTWRAGSPATLGASFQIGGRPGTWNAGAWCEAPPFRFVGLASDLVDLGYTGHYTRAHDDDETARGVVYQMTAQGGRARYLAAIADPCNADTQGRGPAVLSFAEVFTAEDSSDHAAEKARRLAARKADTLADAFAQEARDLDSAYQAGARAAEEWREAEDARAAFLALRAEVKAARAQGQAPGGAICGALVAQARGLAEEWRKARARVAARRAGDDPDREGLFTWWPSDKAQADAFAEGFAQ